MTTNFPTSLDNGTTLPNPNTTDKTNSPSLAGQQGNQNDAIKAVETKVGTGSSTPTSNTLMFGTGSGTSAWTQLTSSQLASSLSDETGSGAAVFANTPTLVTPKVDTINESTPSNGVTVGGVGLKSGVVTGSLTGVINSSNVITTANITDGVVTPAKLVTGTGSTWAGVVWSPTLVGFSVNPTGVYRYTVVGKTVTLNASQLTNGTSNSTSFTMSLPFTAATITNMQWTNPCQVVDNGSSSIGLAWISSGGTVVTIGTSGQGGLTNSGNKRTLGMQITYEVA